MKNIQFTYNSGIAIVKIGKSILIITKGYDSPFNYDALIKNALQEFQGKDEIINVYIDMLSCVGSNEQRFCNINYNFTNKSFDFNSFLNISETSLPRTIKNELKKFYLTDKTSIINNLLVSEKQQYTLLQAV